MTEFIERHKRTLLGKPNDPEGLADVGRELFGESTGNARAKVFADAIEGAREDLRQRFNAAGGAIAKLDNYGVPMRYEPARVRDASPERWVEVVSASLDRSRMIDERTGVPFTDEGLRAFLLDVRETIRTNGMTGEPSAAFRGAGKIANRGQEHRVLHYKDFDAWQQVAREFGTGDNLFSVIMGSISGRARDIAMMERLGPNPDATVRFLLDGIAHDKAKGDEAFVPEVSAKSVERSQSENLWRYVKGEASAQHVYPDPIRRGVVTGLQGGRNLITAAWLGSASLSSISDVHTQAMARGFYGLPETNLLTRTLASLRDNAGQLSAENRAAAARLALGMEDAAHSLGESARYIGEVSGPAWTQVTADAVLRLSALNRLTENRKSAFGQALLGAIADERARPWGEISPGLRTAMERNGIDQHDWIHIRRATTTIRGSEFIDPSAIDVAAIGGRKAQDRLLDMVIRGQAMAVQEASMTSRALANPVGLAKGSISGELWTSALQFKGFAVALMAKHARIVGMLGRAGGAAYAAQFFIGLTMYGAAVIQLRELAKGNDPRPMDKPEFWADAALQGGGIGILGDLVGVFKNDRIDSLGQFIGGPIYGAVQDARSAVRTALPGKERKDGTSREGNPGKGAVRFARRYVPGSNLWYARLAWERMVIDQLDAQVNPDHDADVKQRVKRSADNHQGMYWQPGTMAPQRAPNWRNGIDSTNIITPGVGS
ncbi:hypothetical protein [Sphingomonas sp. GV3]|uniref:hypothetical protein n=1 Tax=Sphingomonas sp. GV3 TaxID=3040671 RepID=UPI00280B7411|nr:hypothetical protein [Sphingomonas sp. GV3]